MHGSRQKDEWVVDAGFGANQMYFEMIHKFMVGLRVCLSSKSHLKSFCMRRQTRIFKVWLQIIVQMDHCNVIII